MSCYMKELIWIYATARSIGLTQVLCPNVSQVDINIDIKSTGYMVSFDKDELHQFHN